MLGTHAQALNLLRREFSHHFGRGTHDQAAIGKRFALGNHRASTHHAMATNASAIQHHRSNANQALIANGATMQHDLVTHSDVFAHHHGQAVVGMDDGQILHIAALANMDGLGVATQHGTKPHAGVGLQGDGPHHLGRVRHPSAGINMGGVVIELVNCHGFAVH